MTYHSGKQAEVGALYTGVDLLHILTSFQLPRNYVTNLEAQLERLRKENQELRNGNLAVPVEEVLHSDDSLFPVIREALSTHTDESATPIGSPNHLQSLVKSVRNVVVEPSQQPRFLGPSSGITLARMVMASIRTDHLPPICSQQTSNNHGQSKSTPGLTPTAESSLPPRHAADHLIDVYFQYRTPHLPIVERSQVESALESAYNLSNGYQHADGVHERDMFTTYMVFAIALCNVPNPSGGTNRVMQSEGCFRSAIGWVEKAISYSRSDLKTLRAVLLLAQFVSMCPWQGSLWHLTGIAVRLCVDIGLHWEAEGQSIDTAPEVLYERRRLWYSAYQFDRVMGITLGRPFGITDEHIRVPLPNPWAVAHQSLGTRKHDFDIHHQRAHNHLFSMSKLESEIKHVQQSRNWPTKVAYPRPNLASWIQDIQPRLQEWYSTIPCPSSAHPSSIFARQAYWDSIFNSCILLLYRPSSSMQHLPTETLMISYKAACDLISSIKTLQREGRLDVLWRSVHQLFIAGLTLIYDLWESREIRDKISVSSSISTLQACASTLAAMSEAFPGASGCRDVFESLSRATIDWLVTNGAEETRPTRTDFEKQVEDLLQQLNPSREAMYSNEDSVMDMSDMLSTNIFSFGEMLSSAAQWPEFSDLGYSAIDPTMTLDTYLGL